MKIFIVMDLNLKYFRKKLILNVNIMYFRYFKVAATTLVIFTVISWFTTGYIAYSNKHMPK